LYDGNPPCDTCQKPKELLIENHLSWKIWAICDRTSRQIGFSSIGPIDVKTAIELCHAYDGYLEDFEKVLMIEDIVFPRLISQAKKRADLEASQKKRKPTIH